jgi:hypothetical protein
MPTATLLDLSPSRATAKSCKLTTSGHSTATFVTIFSTNSGEGILQAVNALLATLQEQEIHAPPGPRPARASARGITKTQLQAKHMAAKNGKANAVKDKKIIAAAHKAKTIAKKQERLISSAKAKAAKAAKADKLHTKQAEATKAGTSLTPQGRSMAPTLSIFSHSHKKSKGIAGAPSPVPTPAAGLKLSPQQKMTNANKRVSIQSPLWFPLRSSEDLSISGSTTSSSGEDKVLRQAKTPSTRSRPHLLLRPNAATSCFKATARRHAGDAALAVLWHVVTLVLSLLDGR